MESLTTRLLRVPTLQSKEGHELVKPSVMDSTHGGRGCNTRGGSGDQGHPLCTYCNRMSHTQEICFSFHNFFEQDLPMSLRLKLLTSNSLMENIKIVSESEV